MLTTFEACYYGMKSLLEYDPVEGLFHKSVLDEVKGYRFKVDRVSSVKVIDDYRCDVISKGEKRQEAHRISLEKGSRFLLNYRIKDVLGQRISKEDRGGK